ncbi:hypothetical protein EB796_008971 [Bugula neritina]|nr:hypothetical protein EB796_008971 [Bugula neritina]
MLGNWEYEIPHVGLYNQITTNDNYLVCFVVVGLPRLQTRLSEIWSYSEVTLGLVASAFSQAVYLVVARIFTHCSCP